MLNILAIVWYSVTIGVLMTPAVSFAPLTRPGAVSSLTGQRSTVGAPFEARRDILLSRVVQVRLRERGDGGGGIDDGSFFFVREADFAGEGIDKLYAIAVSSETFDSEQI